jgi:magnesium chelatase subunit I
MHAEIRTVKDPILRVRIVEERTSFDLNPQKWIDKYETAQASITKRIIDAQNILSKVEIDYDLRVKISEICSILDVDGLRGDIVTNRAAKAYAAYNNREKVEVKDIETIIFVFALVRKIKLTSFFGFFIRILTFAL